MSDQSRREFLKRAGAASAALSLSAMTPSVAAAESAPFADITVNISVEGVCLLVARPAANTPVEILMPTGLPGINRHFPALYWFENGAIKNDLGTPLDGKTLQLGKVGTPTNYVPDVDITDLGNLWPDKRRTVPPLATLWAKKYLTSSILMHGATFDHKGTTAMWILDHASTTGAVTVDLASSSYWRLTAPANANGDLELKFDNEAPFATIKPVNGNVNLFIRHVTAPERSYKNAAPIGTRMPRHFTMLHRLFGEATGPMLIAPPNTPENVRREGLLKLKLGKAILPGLTPLACMQGGGGGE